MLEKIIEAFAVKKPFLSAVVLAGGSGSRFGGDVPKQFTEVLGKPVIARTLLAFEKCADVNEIVIVCRAGETELYEQLARQNGITKLSRAVEGGETRQSSSVRGFAAVSDKADYVAFHDGARCLIKPEAISAVLREARACRSCAIAASAVTDTVKEKTALGKVTKTLDRSTLSFAATPQIFYANVYRAAAFTAEKEGFVGTDDASLAEKYGFEVRLVECGRDNIKITYPEDVIFAEAMLRARGEEG
ncbi:MAG: 2-C-methyl-D-erythritol 4-phosphate cytidylyltransferase [Clostridia bacterium]|nr:2-C-methyl-D-erythritol 4-phosphate cytidylyltransferase [Clostridia bacterium]